VLKARYEVKGGHVKDGGRDKSALWKELVRIRDGVGWRWGVGLSIIFRGRLEMGLILFPGQIPLSVRFLRLFELSVNRRMMVASMFSLG